MSRVTIIHPITARYRPDLIGEHFHVDKPSLTPGENFNIQFSVANRKVYNDLEIDASSSPVKLYLSKDSKIDVFDREIGSYNLGSLAGNAKKVKTVSVTLPPPNDPIWSSDNQRYTIGMIVDPDNDIDEYSWRRGSKDWDGDKNNSNIGIGKDSQPITIRIPSLIDLSLQSFYTDLETNSGSDISVNFQIKNSGNKDLTNIPIDFYLSENSIISNSRDKYLGSYNLSSLSKDSTTGTLKKKLNLPSSSDTFWSGSGKYYIGAIVDPNNNISETDESNNSTHRNIDIDLVPNVSIENTTGTVMEGDEGTTNAIFTVDLGIPSEETIEIGYDTDPDILRVTGYPSNLIVRETVAGSDYKATKGILTFNPGETTKEIVVPIIGDKIAEFNEPFYVYLFEPSYLFRLGLLNPLGVNILAKAKSYIKNDDTGLYKQSFDIAENSDNKTIIGTLNLNYSPKFYYLSERPILNMPDDFITRQLTFKITNNVDPDNDGNSAFSLDGDRLMVNDSDDLDYETNPILNISIEASNGELTDEATVTINLTDIDDNQVPTDLKLDNKTINENEPDNSIIGNFSTTDLDSGDKFTYELVTGNGDTDNKAFTINNDQLKINNSPNYENQSSYSILVQTTDKSGASYQKQLTIKVKNINEAPKIINQSFDIAENSDNQNLIGTINATDPENDTLKFSIINNVDTNKDGNSAFILDGDRLLVNDSKDLDYETNPILNFNVEVSDEELKDEATITVNLSDIQELKILEKEGTATFAKDKNGNYLIVNGDKELQLQNRQGKTYSDDTNPNWDAIAVELDPKSENNYRVLLQGQNARNGQAYIWTSNSDGVITKGSGWKSKNDLLYIEEEFNIDLNNDELIGSPFTIIEDEGTATFAKDKNDGTYWIINGEKELQLQNRQGKTYSDNTTPNWDAVAVGLDAKSENNYRVLLQGQNARDGQAYIWTSNSDGVITKGSGWKSKNDLLSIEEEFNIDLNNDELIGSPFTIIEDKGTATFAKDKNDGTYWIINGEKELQLQNRLGKIYSDNTDPNWDAIAVELATKSENTYRVLLQGQNARDGQAYILTSNSDGVITKGSDWKSKNDLLSIEEEFNIDLNNDELIGSPFTIIEDEGTATFAKDEDGTYLIIDENKELQLQNRQGKTYSDNTTTNWDAVAVELDPKSENIYRVLLQGQNVRDGQAYVWTTNSDGVITKGSGWKSGDTLLPLEQEFDIDLNGDSLII